MSTTPFSFGLPKTTAATNTGFTFGALGTASIGTTTGTSLFGVPSISASPALGIGLQTAKPTIATFGSPGFGVPSQATAVTTTIAGGLPTASSTGLPQTPLFGLGAAGATGQPATAQPAFGLASTPGASVAPNQPVFRLPSPAVTSTIQASAPSAALIRPFSLQQTKTTASVIGTVTPSFGSPAVTASATTAAASTTGQVQPVFGQSSLPGFTGLKTTAPVTGTTPLNFGIASHPSKPTIAVSTTNSTGGFQFPQQSGSPAVTTTAVPTPASTLKFGIVGSAVSTTSTTPIPAVTSAIAGQVNSATATSTAATTTLVMPSLGTVSTSAPATNVSAPAKLPTTMTYNQLEELINKWTHELDEQERYFSDEAARVNSWDQALLTNSEKIVALYEKVEGCKRDQTQLEQEFELIESQQRELEGLLEVVEKASNDLVPRSQLHSDFEREALLQTASNVDLELGQLLTDLKAMASQVNAAGDREGAFLPRGESADEKHGGAKGAADAASSVLADSGPGPTAVQQVTRIINCHLQSLNWIHQNSQDLMERIKALDSA